MRLARCAPPKLRLPAPGRDVVRALASQVSLPASTVIDLGERGRAVVCDLPGPSADSPVVVLVHGLGATAGINWHSAFDILAQQYRVVAVDLRGHGRASRRQDKWRLADCADDIAATCAALGVERAIVAGYSMGGPVAQLVWHRHPELVEGLILCATTTNFSVQTERRVFYQSILPPVVGLLQLLWPARPALVAELAEEAAEDAGPALRSLPGWLWEEGRTTNLISAVQAMWAMGRFSSDEWIGHVDVPTAVVVTKRDRAVPPDQQRRMAGMIAGSTVHEIDGGHVVCIFGSGRFRDGLREAVDTVATRAGVSL